MAAVTLHAGEITIEQKPFVIEATFNATIMPEGEVLLLEVDAKAWEDFRLINLAPHGARITKGGVLAGFDTLGIDRKLEDTRRSIAAGSLAVAHAEQELKSLVETAPHRLEAARRAAQITKEEHAYFTATRRKAEEETAHHRLERSKQQLSNQQEELRQLSRMYQTDDLTKDTEETEEIILTRQKDSVISAEFALRMETLNKQYTLKVALPREALTLADSERDTALALGSAEKEIPRSIERKKLELEALKTAQAREQQTLADLQLDRKLCEFKAPADGWFYHGALQNGRWTTGENIKNLVKNGRPPVRRPFATFIPASAPLAIVAFPVENTARLLVPALTGTATFPGREDSEFPVKLTQLAGIPEPDGGYCAHLTATWPADPKPAAGATLQVRLISYQKPAAIVIPTKALAHDSRGWTAEIKLADGKTERRTVKRGRVSGDDTEILDGLEIGQVILAP
jgi:hypothetical protein